HLSAALNDASAALSALNEAVQWRNHARSTPHARSSAVASRPANISRPADDQSGRLGGDHRVDSGEFAESSQSIGHGVAVAEQLGGAGADAARGQVRLHGLDQALPFDRAA